MQNANATVEQRWNILNEKLFSKAEEECGLTTRKWETRKNEPSGGINTARQRNMHHSVRLHCKNYATGKDKILGRIYQ